MRRFSAAQFQKDFARTRIGLTLAAGNRKLDPKLLLRRSFPALSLTSTSYFSFPLPMSVQLNFPFPVSLLLSEARLIVAAAKDPTYRRAITPRLLARVPDFIEETEILISTVENSGISLGSAGGDASKSTAVGGGMLSGDVDALVHRLNDLVRGAKNSARLAFAGDAAKQRDEFQVGINKPNNLAAVLARAKIIARSCAEDHNAGALAFEGWLSADTDELCDIVNKLESMDTVQEAGQTARVRTTGDQNADANILYGDVRTIQNAAALAFPLTGGNPTNQKIREKFRIGAFPPATPTQPAAGSK